MPRRLRTADDGPYFGGELGANPLVGVDFENPFAAAGGDAGVAARPLAFPGALDDPVGELAGDLRRAVVAAVEHDDDLVGEGEPGEAVAELGLLVAGDHQR